MNKEKLQNLLLDIGFNQVEAAVYLTLLQNPSITGYKISSLLGKSRSNVYQALKTLEQKGVILQLQGDGTNRQFRAVPIEQVLDQKEREFLTRKDMISKAFKDLGQDEEDDQIYKLNTLSQVYTEAIKMIEQAEEIIFLDACLLQLRQIETALIQAVARGIKIVLLGTGNNNSENWQERGFNVIVFQSYAPPDRTYESWNFDWFCLAVDGSAFLIANFKSDSEELISALCSRNIYISGWIYSDMLYEIAFNHIVSLFNKGLSREDIWAGINDYTSRYFNRAPGIKRLQAKLAEK
ncbi:MAG: hypothetical protein K9N06_01910 [Candidatus Cloacimonetes bacterium]|nr:hypothetical protein [Candidatus Cloacimonadota bacterium]